MLLFEEFQDGAMAAILDIRTDNFSNFESLSLWSPIKFSAHGGHLGYQNVMILAILNLCVTVMPPIKFWLNRTSGLGGDVV